MTTRTELRRAQRKPRRILRGVLSALLILLWLTGAGLGGPLFGKVDEVSSNDRTSYLPDSAPATEVQNSLDDFLGSDTIPAVVVFEADAEIDDALRDDLAAALTEAAEAEGVSDGSSPVIVSDDGLAAQAFVPIDADADIGDVTA